LEEDDCLAVVIRRLLREDAREELNATAVSTSAAPGLVRDVQPDVAQVRQARAAAAVWLEGQDADQDVVETCTLLVSELLTNAVHHAGTSVQLRLRRHADEVLIEVEDGLSFSRSCADTDDEATGGLGMHLVAALSQRWRVARAVVVR
jgi:anti-sigma regulatory factor (Ser/Thr protein kinase)